MTACPYCGRPMYNTEKRNAAIAAAYEKGGITQKQLAAKYGISEPRVNAILQRYWRRHRQRANKEHKL